MGALQTKREVAKSLKTNVAECLRLSMAVGSKEKFSFKATPRIEIGLRCYRTGQMLLAAILGGVGLLVR